MGDHNLFLVFKVSLFWLVIFVLQFVGNMDSNFLAFETSSLVENSNSSYAAKNSTHSRNDYHTWEQTHCWRKRNVGDRAPYKMLITGAGYSATGYFSKTFTQGGYPVGHERFNEGDVGLSDWLMSSRRNKHSPFDRFFSCVVTFVTFSVLVPT